jgi:uncharacterized protein YigA (DUF484 family)
MEKTHLHLRLSPTMRGKPKFSETQISQTSHPNGDTFWGGRIEDRQKRVLYRGEAALVRSVVVRELVDPGGKDGLLAIGRDWSELFNGGI